jgi:hypothetical protein
VLERKVIVPLAPHLLNQPDLRDAALHVGCDDQGEFRVG